MPTPDARSPVDAVPAAAGPAPSSLRDHVLLLWRHRVAIVASALAFGALAAVWSLRQPVKYEAVATLAMNTARLDDKTQPRILPETFVPLITSPSLATRVIKDLGLDDAAHQLTPTTLLAGTVTVRGVPDSPLIKVAVRMRDPVLASRVANRFSELGVEMALRASRVDVDAVQRELKAMLDEAEQRRTAAERAYEKYRTTAQVELVEQEVDTLLKQRSDLMWVGVDLAAERARLARLEAELAKRERLTSLRQSVVEDSAMAEAARDVNPSAKDLLGLEMRRETPNPVFFNLDEQAATSRATVASMEQQLEKLARSAGLSGAQIARLNQLYERQAQLGRLETELKLATQAYEDVAEKYMGARLAAVGRTPQLTLVDPAIPPDAAVSRYVARNIAIGLSVGGLLACAVIMARQALAA